MQCVARGKPEDRLSTFKLKKSTVYSGLTSVYSAYT